VNRRSSPRKRRSRRSWRREKRLFLADVTVKSRDWRAGLFKASATYSLPTCGKLYVALALKSPAGEPTSALGWLAAILPFPGVHESLGLNGRKRKTPSKTFFNRAKRSTGTGTFVRALAGQNLRKVFARSLSEGALNCEIFPSKIREK
jgi:hypothetical protein